MLNDDINKLKKNNEKNKELIKLIIEKHKNFKLNLINLLTEKYEYKHHNALENKSGFEVHFNKIYTNLNRDDDYYYMKRISVDIYCTYIQNDKLTRDKYYIINLDLLNELSKVDEEFELLGFTTPHGSSGYIRLYYYLKE